MDVLQTSSASKYASRKSSCLSVLYTPFSLSVSLTTYPISVISLSSSRHIHSCLFVARFQTPAFSIRSILNHNVPPWSHHLSLLILFPHPSSSSISKSHLLQPRSGPVGSGEWGADGQPERERKGGRQETLRNYWAGETPWCQKFTCKKKLPASPAFLICIHSVSPLVLSLPASCLLASSFSLSPSLTIFLPPPLCPSVSLIILHCSTCTVVQHWQSELCTHTRMRTSAHSHTHADSRAHRETHAHHFRRPPSSSLTPLHCRHETCYNPRCARASSKDTGSTTSKLHSAHTQCGLLFIPPTYLRN